MKSTHYSQNIRLNNQSLSSLVRFMIIAAVSISLLFGVYYFWDRYVHLGDRTPIEMAISEWEQSVRDNPSDPVARLNLAQHFIANGNYTDAVTQAQEVLSAYPDSDGARLILGIAYTRLDQPQEAASYLKSYVDSRQTGDDSTQDMVLEASMFYLGQNYLALQKPDEAAKILLEALHIDPTDADAMYLLGNAYAQTNQQDLALQAYQNAVKFVPNFLEAYRAMQSSFAALNKPELVVYAQGMEAFSQGDFDQARKVLERAVENLSDYAPAHLGLAMTYEKLGELQLAQASAQRASELVPDDFATNNLLVRLQSDSQ